MSDGGKLLTLVLMFIGGSPRLHRRRRQNDHHRRAAVLRPRRMCAAARTFGAFGRRIAPDTVPKACVVAFTNLSLALLGALWITAADGLPLTDVLLETFSAVGTVGMSTGITRALSAPSRAVVMLLMYCGRVGSLSFAIALTERKPPPDVRDPVESIVIG